MEALRGLRNIFPGTVGLPRWPQCNFLGILRHLHKGGRDEVPTNPMNTPFPMRRQPLVGRAQQTMQGKTITSVRSGDPERMLKEERAVIAAWGRSNRAHFGGDAQRLGRGDGPTVALPGTASPIGVANRKGESISTG